MKEIKTLSMERLRRACIDHNWYNCGTNKDYENILFKANKIENLTLEDLKDIATNILEHSYIEDLHEDEREDYIYNIMFILLNNYCVISIEREEK